MSTENNLNSEHGDSEIKAVEALLKQISPAASKVDRDALLYQAGWAAATAQSLRKTHWLWPTTTAALAASLLILLTFPPASPLQRPGNESLALPQKTEKQVKQLVATTPESKPLRTHARQRPRYQPTAPLLAMRERALRQDFNDLSAGIATDLTSDDWPAAVETNNRQLLKEFLPNSRSLQNTRPKFWSSWNLGETP